MSTIPSSAVGSATRPGNGTRSYGQGQNGSPRSNPKNIAATVVSVGRNKRSSIVIDDDGVSDLHAEIIIYGNRHFLRDLGSDHGTWVNGVHVKMVQVKDGDLLSFGFNRITFTLKVDPEEVAERSAEPLASEESVEIVDFSQIVPTRTVSWPKSSAPDPAPAPPSPEVQSRKTEYAWEPLFDPGEDSARMAPGSGSNVVHADTLESRTRTLWPTLESPFWKRLALVVAGVLVISGITYYRSWVAHQRAYDLGYASGMEEFLAPPRNLDAAMILKFAKPAASRMQIPQTDFDDFVRGMTHASYKTYYERFQTTPHFD